MKTGSADARTGAGWLNMSCQHPNFHHGTRIQYPLSGVNLNVQPLRRHSSKYAHDNPKYFSQKPPMSGQRIDTDTSQTEAKSFTCIPVISIDGK
jgi:hypothetical protein